MGVFAGIRSVQVEEYLVRTEGGQGELNPGATNKHMRAIRSVRRKENRKTACEDGRWIGVWWVRGLCIGGPHSSLRDR